MSSLPSPVRLAIFASGAGSNAANIIRYFAGSDQIHVTLIICNKPQAGVLRIAEEHRVPSLLIDRERFFHQDAYLPDLHQYKIDYIILAGFLWKIPAGLIEAFPHRIINIHPALLPRYGGKGMYGAHVHEAVVANKESETGITIHLVDEKYDNGDILFQATCPVTESDTPDTVARKVHALEYAHFPQQIAHFIEKRETV